MNLFSLKKKSLTRSAIFSSLLASMTVLPLNSSAWAQASGAVAPVQELTHSIDTSLKGNQSYAQRSKTVGSAVINSYDDDAIMSGSIGSSRWRHLSESDKQKLSGAFRDYSVGRYVNSFNPGDKLSFKINDKVAAPKGSPAGVKEVKTQIIPDDNSGPTEVDYLLHKKNGEWKICDILLTEDQISTVAQQHSDFKKVFASGGVDGLVKVLEKKAQESKLK